MFIVIEGIDLVGKSTQHAMLVQHLASLRGGRGRSVAPYSFPAYDSPTGKAIGDHLRGNVALTVQDETLGLPNISEHDSLALQCLQVVDKYAVAPEIAGCLNSGQTVVACRWWQSCYAYGMEASVDAGWVRRSCALLPRADVNILLDLDPTKTRRRPGVSLDRLEADRAQQARIRQRYLDLWRGDTGEHGFWAVVDADGSAVDVHGRILAVLHAAGILLGGTQGRSV